MPEMSATPSSPAVSPSGEFLLKVLETQVGSLDHMHFVVCDRTGEVVYSSNRFFDVRHQLFFLWGDDKDQVWVYSGDLGTFFWELNEESGVWEERVYAQSDQRAPNFLKAKRPRYHKR